MSVWTGDRPPRHDIGWMRHRSLRGRTPATAPTAAPPAPASAAVADFISGRATRPGRQHEQPAPAPAAAPVTARRPAPAGDPLDLSGPPASTPARAPEPARAPVPAGDPLDLSAGSAEPPAPLVPPPPAPRRRPAPRVAAGARTVLTDRRPTVVLTRLQSGIGTLVVEAVAAPAVGDLRLAALYELADGTTSVVSRTTAPATAPPGSRRPVLRASAAEHERLTLDLRQVRALRRLVVLCFSESRRPLADGGTLVLSTFGGARIDLPLELAGVSGAVALLSVHAVDGELVLRAEAEPVDGEARGVARAFGFDRITWVDDRTPAA